MAYTTHSAAHRGHVAERAVAFFDDLKTRYARYRLYRKTLNELSALSARDLADLGLHRSMLKRVAYMAAYEAA